MLYHYIPIKLVKIKSDNIKCWEDCEITRSVIHDFQECKMVQLCYEPVWQFLEQIKHAVTIQSSIPGHLSQRDENSVHTKAYTQIFIAILFVIAQNWRQSKYFSHMWMVIKTMVHLYHGILLSNEQEWVSGAHNHLRISRELWWVNETNTKRFDAINYNSFIQSWNDKIVELNRLVVSKS